MMSKDDKKDDANEDIELIIQDGKSFLGLDDAAVSGKTNLFKGSDGLETAPLSKKAKICLTEIERGARMEFTETGDVSASLIILTKEPKALLHIRGRADIVLSKERDVTIEAALSLALKDEMAAFCRVSEAFLMTTEAVRDEFGESAVDGLVKRKMKLSEMESKSKKEAIVMQFSATNGERVLGFIPIISKEGNKKLAKEAYWLIPTEEEKHEGKKEGSAVEAQVH